MAHRKAGGTAKNLTDSNAQYLGIKLHDGQAVKAGMIIVRQRGTRYLAGANVGLGKDHTIFAKADGTVKFTNKRKTGYNGQTRVFSTVSVEKN